MPMATETCPTCGVRTFDDAAEFMASINDMPEDDPTDRAEGRGRDIALLAMQAKRQFNEIDAIHARIHRLMDSFGATVRALSAVQQNLRTVADTMTRKP